MNDNTFNALSLREKYLYLKNQPLEILTQKVMNIHARPGEYGAISTQYRAKRGIVNLGNWMNSREEAEQESEIQLELLHLHLRKELTV